MKNSLIQTQFNVSDRAAVTITGGSGYYFEMSDGSRVVDGSNTGAPLGHNYPAMTEAMRQAADSPLVNDGWYWEDRAKAADELLAFAFEGEESWVGGVRFCLSGGEANDLALSLAQALTGRSGIATRTRAYHGMVGLSRNVTVQPHWHGGISEFDGKVYPAPANVPVYVLPRPVGALYGEEHVPAGDLLKGAEDTLRNCAAAIVDYTQGGIYYDPEYQDLLAAKCKEAGTLWIADEVVTGLGRYGNKFSFQGASSRPDIVTLGKPLAGGATACGAIVLSKDLVARLQQGSWRTYSTFRGYPRMIAAIRAHLGVLSNDGVIERVAGLEAQLKEGLLELAKKHKCVQRVDGRGLHWTVEFVGQEGWREWTAATKDVPIATKVTREILKNGVMLGTSGEQTSLFVAPPLIIDSEGIEKILEALDKGLDLGDSLV